jgi:hypothetical protein
MMSFDRLRRIASQTSAKPAFKRFSIEQIAWAINVVSQYVPAATCLTQALAGQALLRQAGFDPILRIGVRRYEDHSFGAHAWVECDGDVVIGHGETLEQYTPLPALEGQPVAAM